MNRAIELRALRPIVDRVFPAERWRDAFAQLGSRDRFGKLVVALP
jgi:NADPH:quinone reductase-like Zn-dependent oxidoreductase